MATPEAPRLDARLAAAAQLVKPGAAVADIGCDHGKLAIFLALTGRAKRVIAADLRAGPLQTAAANCRRYGCEGAVELRLGDGLSVLAPGEADTLVLAGVSAKTTIDILSAAPWVKTPGMRLVCVPATKAPVLRRWLWEQGFDIEEERLALAAGRWYAAIGAVYTGETRRADWTECMFGRWRQLPGAEGYQAQLAQKVEKVLRGLEPGSPEWKEAAALNEQLRRPQGAEHGES